MTLLTIINRWDIEIEINIILSPLVHSYYGTIGASSSSSSHNSYKYIDDLGEEDMGEVT
jgi:hypothetical protein